MKMGADRAGAPGGPRGARLPGGAACWWLFSQVELLAKPSGDFGEPRFALDIELPIAY
jgi:hypothetical protein